MDKRNWVYITGSKSQDLLEMIKYGLYYVDGTESPVKDNSIKYMAKYIVYASDMNAYDGWALHRDVSLYGGDRIIVVDEYAEIDKIFEDELKEAGVQIYDTLEAVAKFLNDEAQITG